jgi:SAM-dependent methyltransferase
LALLKERPHYGSSNHGDGAISIVREWLKSIDQPVVADFGCGNNNFLQTICIKKGIGIDFVNPVADLIEPMHNVSIETDTVDIVTSFDALEHILPEEVEDVLAEMARVAKPEGKFVFSISHVASRITSLGENLHPTVETREWWIDKIGEHAYDIAEANSLSTRWKGDYIIGTWK